MNGKNLLILAPHYDNFIKGLGDEISKEFDKVLVVIPIWKTLFSKTIFKNAKKSISDLPNNVQCIEVECSPFLPISVNHILKSIKKQNIRIDCLLSHFLLPYGYLGNKLASKLNCKSIVIGHGYDVYKLPFKNIIFRSIIKSILKRADQVVTVSKKNKKIIDELSNGKKAALIPNGFSKNKFFTMDKSKCKRSLNIKHQNKIILTVGNLIEVKNQITLIESIKLLIKTNKNVSCYIIGSGNLESFLKKRVRELELSDHIYFVGQVNHDEICKWMNIADLFVLPSLSEGNPTVMFENMACGKPYVGTNVGGVKDIINKSYLGSIYEDKKNPILLSEEIKDGLKKNWDQKKILKESEKYNWSKLAKKYMVYLK